MGSIENSPKLSGHNQYKIDLLNIFPHLTQTWSTTKMDATMDMQMEAANRPRATAAYTPMEMMMQTRRRHPAGANATTWQPASGEEPHIWTWSFQVGQVQEKSTPENPQDGSAKTLDAKSSGQAVNPKKRQADVEEVTKTDVNIEDYWNNLENIQPPAKKQPRTQCPVYCKEEYYGMFDYSPRLYYK